MKINGIRCFFLLWVVALLPQPSSAQWQQTNWSGNSTVLSLAVKDSFLFAGTYSGMAITADNGAHWTAAGLPLGSRTLSLAVSGNSVFAGTSGGVYRSTDNGANWTEADSGMPGQTLIHSLVASGTNVFAGTHSRGVFLTSDNGAHWAAVDTGLPATTSVYSLAAGNGLVFAGTYAAGVYGTANNGTTWTACNSGLPAILTGYVFSLVKTGTYLFAGIGNGVYASSDNGTHWTAAGSVLMNTDVYTLAAYGTSLFAGTYTSGVFYSADNGLTWTAVSAGLTSGTQLLCLMVKGTDLFAGTGNYGVWRRPLAEMAGVIQHTPQQGSFQFTIRTTGRARTAMTIEFSLVHPDPVTVKLFNTAGNEITTLVNRNFRPGLNSLRWDTRNLAAGFYTVRLRAGPNIYVKRIMVF